MTHTICILCKSEQLDFVAERGTLNVLKCSSCGLLRGFSTKESGASDAGAVETDPNHFAMLINDDDKLRNIMSRLLSNRQPHIDRLLESPVTSCLEIGPGNGMLSETLEEKNIYWRGVEIDHEMASRMISMGKNVVHGDFANIDTDNIIPKDLKAAGGFDMVFFSQVFEHVTAPAAFLKNAWSSLRPGGVLYLDVPNNDGLTATLRKLNPMSGCYGEIVPPHHMIAYAPSTLRFALNQAGFERIDVFSRTYDDPTFGLSHALLWDNWKLQIMWKAAKLLSKGGNLVAMAKKPLATVA